MEAVKEMLNNISWEPIIKSGLKIGLVLIGTLIVILIVKNTLERFKQRMIKKRQQEGEPPSESAKRIETIVRLIRQACIIAIWLIAGLIILKEIGVEIAPIIASAGIVGLAVGFGAQNLVRDIISGFFIIVENQVRIGDVAIVNGTGGLVEKINLRTIVLRDLSGIVHVFPNGEINTLSNMTNDWSAYVFDIGVAYKENTDSVIEIMKSVGKELKEDDEFGPLMLDEPEIFGVDKFADSAVVIKGRIKTKPIQQWAVGRQFLRRIKQKFDEQNIEIPFPHRTIYVGDESKPFGIKMLERAAEQ